MKTNNVLIIGNGFDIAHGLPTKYEDFLKIFKPSNSAYTLSRVLEIYRENQFYNGEFKELFNKHPELVGKIDSIKIENLEKRLCNNVWAYYYARCGAEIDRWIDFESEIIPVLNLFNEVFCNKNPLFDHNSARETVAILRMDENLVTLRSKLFPKYFENPLHYDGCIAVKGNYCNSTYGILKKKILKDLKDELDDFIDLFRDYLTEIVDKIDICEDPIIKSIDADEILSFNYTRTEKKYEHFKDIETFYIHGNILHDKSMVLGVDEVNGDTENEFIYFVKYFQRIRRHISTHYKDLLSNTNEKGMVRPINTFIYGHSLDRTDKDILLPFIKYAKKVTIYYYNDSDYEQKIINLINLFNKDVIEQDLYDGRIVLLPTQL